MFCISFALLEYDYLLPYFPLLKSREKLLQQDQIWKLICGDLNWQFIEIFNNETIDIYFMTGKPYQ